MKNAVHGLDQSLSRFSVAQRALGGFALVVVFMLVLAYTTWSQRVHIETSIAEAEIAAQVDAALAEMSAGLTNLGRSSRQFLRSHSFAEVLAVRTASAELLDTLQHILQDFATLPFIGGVVLEMRGALLAHAAALEAVVLASEQRNAAVADAVLLAIEEEQRVENALIDASYALEDAAGYARQVFGQWRIEVMDEPLRRTQWLNQMSILMAVSAILLALVLAWLMVGSITRPLQRLTVAMRDLVAGQTNALMPFQNHSDEIGVMAAAVEVFRQNAMDLQKARQDLEALTHTLQATLQTLETANRAKSEFLARMSHEIRTPINIITGMCRLILKTELNDQQKNYLGKIQFSSDILLHIINDILDFSKLESGTLQLESVPFQLEDLLEKLHDLILIRAAQKKIEVIFAVDADLPSGLQGDPFRLLQVLTNLVDNAIKFTDHGEVVVAIQVESVHARQVWLHILVTDSGMGITDEQLHTLFQSFHQADGSIIRNYGGIGLGLVLSQRLVAMMGGELSVSSVVGQGTRIGFSLPFNLLREWHTQMQAIGEARTSGHVFILDDNATVGRVLTQMVSTLGYASQVMTVQDSDAVLRVLADACAAGPHPVVVLINCWIVDRRGISLARRIHAEPGLSQVAVVMMVHERFDHELLQQASDLHLAGVLIKPVLPAKLREILASVAASSADAALARNRDLTDGNATVTDLSAGVAQLHAAKILLVEDNPLNQGMMLRILQDWGLNVVVAANGREAIDQLGTQSFDLILMDLQMPEMDGLTATRKIRAMPGCANLPIIAMTAHAMSGDREISLEAGMDDHLTKPVDFDLLQDVLLRWIQPREVLEQIQPSQLDSAVADATQSLPWPELDGIDWDLAFKRVGGQQQLLCKMIDTFITSNATLPHDLHRAAQSQDFAGLQRLIHSTKGALGIIGAEGLAKNSRLIEEDLRQDKRQKALQRLPGFVDELSVLLATLTEFYKTYVQASPDMQAVANDVLAEQLRQLEVLLAHDDSQAHDLWRSIQPVLAKHIGLALDTDQRTQLCADIQRQIDELEYGEALALLRTLEWR